MNKHEPRSNANILTCVAVDCRVFSKAGLHCRLSLSIRLSLLETLYIKRACATDPLSCRIYWHISTAFLEKFGYLPERSISQLVRPTKSQNQVCSYSLDTGENRCYHRIKSITSHSAIDCRSIRLALTVLPNSCHPISMPALSKERLVWLPPFRRCCDPAALYKLNWTRMALRSK